MDSQQKLLAEAIKKQLPEKAFTLPAAVFLFQVLTGLFYSNLFNLSISMPAAMVPRRHACMNKLYISMPAAMIPPLRVCMNKLHFAWLQPHHFGHHSSDGASVLVTISTSALRGFSSRPSAGLEVFPYCSRNSSSVSVSPSGLM